MAVSLPADLVLDVLRNADPSRLQQAAANLARRSGATETARSDFSGMMERLKDKSGSGAASAGDLISDVMMAADTKRVQAAEAKLAEGGSTLPLAYRSFEQMVLRNLFESMLPAEDSAIYGKDISAGIWRSMAADQFAGVYAGSGAAGIAEKLMTSAAIPGSDPEIMNRSDWPYFSTGEIRGFTG